METVFDTTGTYRYCLWRCWADPSDPLVFILLNPSTADHQHDDPTIRRCRCFAQQWGYGAMVVVNLFAYRASQPRQLKHVADPIGPDNDAHLQSICQQASRLVLGWGNHGSFLRRDRTVGHLLYPHRLNCYWLGQTRQQQPLHPLYLSGHTPLVPIPQTYWSPLEIEARPSGRDNTQSRMQALT